jgi:hypothetical protein
MDHLTFEIFSIPKTKTLGRFIHPRAYSLVSFIAAHDFASDDFLSYWGSFPESSLPATACGPTTVPGWSSQLLLGILLSR